MLSTHARKEVAMNTSRHTFSPWPTNTARCICSPWVTDMADEKEYIGWSDVTYMWSQCDRHICRSKRRAVCS